MVWARDMEQLLRGINQVVDDAGGVLPTNKEKQYRKEYKTLLKKADRECSAPGPPPGKPKRGRVKRNKASNSLERLIDYQD